VKEAAGLRLSAARGVTAGKHATTLETLVRVVPEPLLDQLRLRLFGIPTAFGSRARAELPAQ
jgi:hypothetical protein